MNALVILEAVSTALAVVNQLVPQLISTVQSLRGAIAGKPTGAPLAMRVGDNSHLELAGTLRIAAGDLTKQAEALEAAK